MSSGNSWINLSIAPFVVFFMCSTEGVGVIPRVEERVKSIIGCAAGIVTNSVPFVDVSSVRFRRLEWSVGSEYRLRLFSKFF